MNIYLSINPYVHTYAIARTAAQLYSIYTYVLWPTHPLKVPEIALAFLQEYVIGTLESTLKSCGWPCVSLVLLSKNPKPEALDPKP